MPDVPEPGPGSILVGRNGNSLHIVVGMGSPQEVDENCELITRVLMAHGSSIHFHGGGFCLPLQLAPFAEAIRSDDLRDTGKSVAEQIEAIRQQAAKDLKP